MIRYDVTMYWSEEDDTFVAEAPELPGRAADGSSYQEALANLEIIIQQWIDTDKQLGRPIPSPSTACRSPRFWVLLGSDPD